MVDARNYGEHSLYSDPGVFGSLFADVPTEPSELSAVARNVIVHFRSVDLELPEHSVSDINARWVEELLRIDQRRHPKPLSEHRPAVERVQGCCRDFTLFCLSALRSRGIPVRSRVGFAGYFETEGWHNDHVIVEAWADGEWFRFDPELASPMLNLHDELASTGFVSSAQVWAGLRDGAVDPSTYGVDPSVPVLRGERFVFNAVIVELAHRYCDELLLWDAWGRMGDPNEPVAEEDAEWMDGVVRLLLAADHGDPVAERQLHSRYQHEEDLRPGPVVLQASPVGDPPIKKSLRRAHR